MSNVKDYALKGKKYKEDREPKIKNPNLEGTVCKHCVGVLEQIDKFKNSIIRDLKQS